MSVKTTERDIVKSSTTALKTASKRRRCSSSFNLESKVEEYYAREESLNEKIAALTEENLRTQLNNLDLHRVIRAKTSIEELRPEATAEEVIEAAWDVNESIRAIAEEHTYL